MSGTRRIRRVLIANRGEIAVRIIRTLRTLGIESYVVAADPDADSLAVRLADGAVTIGGTLASESYADLDKIVEAARLVSADAVHPGYGFLSERPELPSRLAEAGIEFIGPTADQIAMLGDKLQARKAMASAGVSPVPGVESPIGDVDDTSSLARDIGFPLLLKAAAGGGGKGIRIVRHESELDGAFRLATSEAQSSFGSPLLFAERYLEEARHVEIQIVGDGEGGVRIFQERDCSIQRRLQKLIEETPCPVLEESARQRLFEAARKLVAETRYRGAGTLEFLLSKEGELFFLEMNTRIQVEHPVTEEISGVDLIALQMAVAQGELFPGARLSDCVVPSTGAAIEFRVNSEDPLGEFRPSAGTIEALHLPQLPGVRIDTALTVGAEITPYYDPLLAKVIGTGRDREEAIARLTQALDEILISGVDTTLPVGGAMMKDSAFLAGDYHCQSLRTRLDESSFLRAPTDDATLAALAVGLATVEHERRCAKRGPAPVAAPPRPRWCELETDEA